MLIKKRVKTNTLATKTIRIMSKKFPLFRTDQLDELNFFAIHKNLFK